MDELDLDIIAAYYERPFDSYEEIGRRLGMTGAAVRARLAKLTEEGFLLGCFPRVPGRLVGRDQYAIELQGVSLPHAADRLLEHDEVLTAMTELDGHALVRAYSPRGAKPDLTGIQAAAGGRVTNSRLVGEPPGAKNIGLSDAERVMLAGILDAPCEPIASVARLSSRPPQTVQRLEDRLVAEGVLHMESLLSLTRATGAHVESVRVHAKETAEELLRRVGSLRAWTRFGDDHMLLSPARSLHDARIVRGEVQALAPGALFETWAEAVQDPAKLAAWVREPVDALTTVSKGLDDGLGRAPRAE